MEQNEVIGRTEVFLGVCTQTKPPKTRIRNFPAEKENTKKEEGGKKADILVVVARR